MKWSDKSISNKRFGIVLTRDAIILIPNVKQGIIEFTIEEVRETEFIIMEETKIDLKGVPIVLAKIKSNMQILNGMRQKNE